MTAPIIDPSTLTEEQRIAIKTVYREDSKIKNKVYINNGLSYLEWLFGEKFLKEDNMIYLAVNSFSVKNSYLELKERIFKYKPVRQDNKTWAVPYSYPGTDTVGIGVPDGTIAKIIGRELTWNDEPVEI